MARSIAVTCMVPGSIGFKRTETINPEKISRMWSGPSKQHGGYDLWQMYSAGTLKDVVVEGKEIIFTHIKIDGDEIECFESEAEINARINGQHGAPRGLVNKSEGKPEGKPESKVSNK